MKRHWHHSLCQVLAGSLSNVHPPHGQRTKKTRGSECIAVSWPSNLELGLVIRPTCWFRQSSKGGQTQKTRPASSPQNTSGWPRFQGNLSEIENLSRNGRTMLSSSQTAAKSECFGGVWSIRVGFWQSVLALSSGYSQYRLLSCASLGRFVHCTKLI